MFSFQQIKALASGFICMLIFGSGYTYGTLMPYAISHIYYAGDKDINSNKMGLLLPVSVIVINLGMPLSNLKQLQFSNKIITLIAMLGISLSVFVMSFAENFWLYLLCHSFGFSMFNGFGYMGPIKNCVQHIPLRKGLCSGFCILGQGLSALLFNVMLLNLINPDNQDPLVLPDNRQIYRQEVANNVPFALKIMSAAYLGIGLLGIFLMRPPKQQTNSQQKQQSSLIENQAQKYPHQSIQQSHEQSISKQNRFSNWREQLSYLVQKKILWLILTVSGTLPFGIFIVFNYKQYGQTKINDDAFLTLAGSIGAIFNGVARLFWGVLLDKLSFRTISAIMNILNLAFAISLSFIVTQQYIYLVAVCIIYFVYAGYSIYPAFTMKIFGPVQGSRVYWLVFAGITFACLFQFLIRAILVSDNNKFNDFTTCFYIFAGFNVLALVLSLTIKYDLDDQHLSVKNNENNDKQ